MSWLDFIIRLAVAFLLGSVIGLERQWRQQMAGLRTNTLVATGAALFVMLGVMTPGGSPTPIEAYIVSGVGFLGGGLIFWAGASVQGLNLGNYGGKQLCRFGFLHFFSEIICHLLKCQE